MTARTRAPREINGLTWGPVPGQRTLPLFLGDWFECTECGHEAHVDSTPVPGDLCWQCALERDEVAGRE